MAVPAFVSVSDERNGNPEGTTSLTLTVPAGSNGDLLVAVVGVKVNPSMATPSGWNPIIAGFNGCTSASDSSIGIRAQLNSWWRIADGTENTVTFTWGAQVIRQASGAILRYSGADATQPIDASACDKGTSSSPTAPSVTTTSADDRILRVVVSDADDAKSKFTSEPATQRWELESTSVFGPGSSYTSEAVVTAGSDAAQSSPGPTGTAAWGLPSSEQWAAQTIAIRPDGYTDAQQGCAAVIVEFVRRIWEAIRDAITGGSKAVKQGVNKRRDGKDATPPDTGSDEERPEKG